VSLSSCLGIDEAAARIQQSIDDLVRQSSEWQVTLQKLETDLIKGGQSLIANEVTQLAQRGIGTAGTELRCDADFVGHRMLEGLQRIKSALLRQTPQPLRQYFCGVSPTSINLALSADRRTELAFYGYNLDSGRATVYVRETNGNQRVVPNPQLILATPTHYLMTVNISQNNGLVLGPNDQKVVFVLNPGLPSEESHDVLVIAAPADPTYSIVAGSAVGAAGGGGFSQGPYRRSCQAGSIGVGLNLKSGEFIYQIQLVCAVLNRDGSLGAISSPPADGGSEGDASNLGCPSGQTLVGFTGRSSGNVERVGLQCSKPADVVAERGAVTLVGPNRPGGGGSPFSSPCRPQFAVTGLVIWSNDRVSRMDFTCSALQLR